MTSHPPSFVNQSLVGTAPAPHPTVADAWHPRPEEWRQRGPSPYAGRANRPLFIGACPRSGTTLLRSMLNNHPDLAMPPETNFLVPLWRKRARFGDLRVAENRRKLAEWVVDTPGLGGRRIRAKTFDRKRAIERVVAAPGTLGSVIAAFFEMFAEAKGKTRWGDKRPGYTGYLDAIFQLFPDAQFVNLIRDPRAAVASQLPIGWGKEHMVFASATCNWEMAVRNVDRYADRLRPDQLLDVRYEDLVRDPAATLQAICEFAGLRDGDVIEQMIYGPRRGVFNEGWHDRLSEPVNAAPVDRWRERLEPDQVAFIEHVTGGHFERFGYRPEVGPDAAPARSELRKLRKQRRRRRRKWRRYALGEVKRRYVTARRPVAAAD